MCSVNFDFLIYLVFLGDILVYRGSCTFTHMCVRTCVRVHKCTWRPLFTGRLSMVSPWLSLVYSRRIFSSKEPQYEKNRSTHNFYYYDSNVVYRNYNLPSTLSFFLLLLSFTPFFSPFYVLFCILLKSGTVRFIGRN